ncbi:MAG: MFS transporter, partial [Aestuariivirga sp.]
SRNSALLFGIIIAMGACNIATGMLVQVIPLAMDAVGASKFLIGNNTMAGQAGVLVAGLSLVWARQHFKSHLLVMGALVIAFCCYAGFAFTAPLYAWYALRFITGIAIAIVFTTGESWLQANVSDASRGRVMGAYMTSQTLTFALGPFLITYIGFIGPAPWLFGFGAIALSIVLMSQVKVPETAHGERPANLWATTRKGAFAFLCVGMVTFFEAFCLTFFTLYAVKNGFSADTATQLLSFGIAGCVLFFFAIGYLGDHWSHTGTIAICSVGAVIFALLEIPLVTTIWIWPLIVLLRATAFGNYLGGYALMGDKFKGAEMVAASSINSIMWGVSGMVGPPMAGLAFDRWGLGLLPWFMAACFAPILLVLTVKKQKLN